MVVGIGAMAGVAFLSIQAYIKFSFWNKHHCRRRLPERNLKTPDSHVKMTGRVENVVGVLGENMVKSND